MIREYARMVGLTVDRSGKRTVPSPKTMITFRCPQVRLSFAIDVDCSFWSINDGNSPDPTASYPITATANAATAVLRHFKRAKQPDTRRKKRIIKVIIC